jgi:riboflavin kinase/FMN adenylyltransferase
MSGEESARDSNIQANKNGSVAALARRLRLRTISVQLMQVLHQIDDLSRFHKPVVLAIGVFDGVHAGHQHVIAAALRRARERGAEFVLMTFEPHPIRVLRPQSAPKRLCSPAHQLRLLARYAVENVLLCAFDETFARIPAEDFIESLAKACQRLDSIFVGDTWQFGAQRRGDLAMLKSHGERLGFEAFGIAAVTRGEAPISSTRVRQAVSKGELREALALLARDYSVQGRVVEGKRLARSLGFPTANILVENEQLPPPGVYAVRASTETEAIWHPGVANLGLRPTVDEHAESLTFEVHLLDTNPDLYGHLVEVCFVQHLRDEQKFSGLDALKAQIGRDCEAARAALAGVGE